MEFDKKPNVIKFEGSKLQVMQQLTDQLAVKMGKSKFNWENDDLKKNVSLAEIFNELTKNLDILGKDYVSVACNGYCGKDNVAHTKTTTTYSSNNSSVCTKNCNGYEFISSGSGAYSANNNQVSSCGGCISYCSPDTTCSSDQTPGL